MVGIQLWRRAAQMVAACVPTAPAADAADLIPAARDRRLGELGGAGVGAPAAEGAKLAAEPTAQGGRAPAPRAAPEAGAAAGAEAARGRGPGWFAALRLVHGSAPPACN